MAQGVATPHPITGVQQTFDGMFWTPIDANGSDSYVQGGDTMTARSFGFNSTIWTIAAGIDQSGKWQVIPRCLAYGYSPWQLVWISLTTATIGGVAQTAGQEAAAGTDLSSFTVRLAALGQ